MSKIKNNVLIGEKGYLFLYQGGQYQFDFLTQQRFPSSKSILNFAKNILDREKFFRSRTIKYRHIVFPSKPLICKEYIPEYSGRLYSLFETIYRPALNSDSLGYVIYPISKLQSKDNYVLKTDTHYSALGFLKVFEEVISNLYPDNNLNLLSYKIKEARKIGDLANMLDEKSEDIYKIPYASNMQHVKNFSNKEAIPGNTNDIFIAINENSVSNKRLLLFGDSFLKGMIKFFSYYFKDVVYIRSEFVHKEIVDQIVPDVVLTGSAERYLSNVKSDSMADNYLMILYGLSFYRPPQKFLNALKAQLSFGYNHESYLFIRNEIIGMKNNAELLNLKNSSEFELISKYSKDFFPSLGYFGPGKLECLSVRVGQLVSTIYLSLKTKKNVLNLKNIEFLDYSGELITDFTDSIISCSSSWADKEPDTLISNQGFHSKNEPNPYWCIIFNNPIPISSINLFNRADKWGSRNSDLVVSFIGSEGEVSEFNNNNINNHSDMLLFISSLFVDEELELQLSVKTGEEFRNKILIPKLISMFKKGHVNDANLRCIANILPFWSNNRICSEDEIELFSLYFHKISKGLLSYQVKQYSEVLDTKYNIDLFVNFLNNIRAINKQSRIMLTKHGLSSEGKLVSFKSKAMDTLKIIIKDLEEEGYIPMLSYGTLLGAYRDSSFMVFDDDIDIIMKFSSTNIISVRKEMQALSDKMSKRGYKIGALNDNLNRHFLNTSTGVPIDVFPCWLEDNRMQLHMEKMKIRGIDPDIFKKTSSVMLYGEAFPGPTDIEGFLLERYGSEWSIEDKFHEWPWILIG